MDTIEGMRVFVAVAATSSFTGAGRRLGLSTKLVSRYVGQLEARLNTQLLNRTTRSVALTDAGQAYYASCRPLLEAFDELEAAVLERQSALVGPIHLTASTAFGSGCLASALAPFLAKHPKVSFKLHLTDQRVALVEEGFDLAIRIGPMRSSSLIAKKLAPMPLVVCASPDYLASAGRPRDVRALATHQCLIDENITEQDTWRFRVGGEEVGVRINGPIRVNSPLAVANLAALGLGIGLCPQYVVEAFVADGRLQILFLEEVAAEFAIVALYPPHRRLTTRVRALIDHLAITLAPAAPK
jgi:DNA-binding transcriptional LysR family regulator